MTKQRRAMRNREPAATEAQPSPEGDEERARLLARSYQWLRPSQRRRLAVLDAREVAARYPWIARTEAARRTSRPPSR
jgi:hypothetical protein